MKKFDLNYYYWLATAFAKKLGAWGLLGLVISVACLLFYLTQVMPLKQSILANQQSIDMQYTNQPTRKMRAYNHLQQADNLQQTPAQTTTQDIAAFYKIFPNGASLPKWLALINTAALQQHLILNHGDYKLSQTKQSQLSRYEIVLPVAGQYAQVRAFIANVLQISPALALSDVQIKRDNTLNPNVDAKLVFVLFLQGNAW